nr:hypothetical protein [Rhodococcus sp. 06-418-1B]
MTSWTRPKRRGSSGAVKPTSGTLSGAGESTPNRSVDAGSSDAPLSTRSALAALADALTGAHRG